MRTYRLFDLIVWAFFLRVCIVAGKLELLSRVKMVGEEVGRTKTKAVDHNGETRAP